MYREFTDDAGKEWRVWEVRPEAFRVHGRDARYIAPELAHGWLSFESSTGERRRLAPYPSEWPTLPDEELAALCRVAPRAPFRARGEHHGP
jgi:hypothetical protein